MKLACMLIAGILVIVGGDWSSAKLRSSTGPDDFLRPSGKPPVFKVGGQMTQTHDEVRNTVREHYAKVAESNGVVGCAPGCCGSTPQASLGLGYSAEDLAGMPDGADMGLGCGNPQAIASLRA